MDAALRTAAEYRSAFRMLASRVGWSVEVQTCSGLTGTGIAETWACIERYREWYEATGVRSRRRNEQARGWLWSEIADAVRTTIESRDDLRRLVETLEEDVAESRTPAAEAARRVIMAAFRTEAGRKDTKRERDE